FRGSTDAELAGRDGRLLWRTPVVEGGFALHGHPGPSGLGDLDGDGVLDLVLWMPKEGRHQHGEAGELRALSGRDGKVLWSVNLFTGPNDRPLWPRVPLGDLDGDGVPEAVVTIYRFDEKLRTNVGEVIALDGRDGRRRWTWSFRAGQESRP